jgi:hypothetical protein
MATIQHASIPDTDLHEPKGIVSAANKSIYVADGIGSGAWKQIYTQGFEDYSHAGSFQSLTAGVDTKLLNDGAGALTNTTYRLPGYGAIWNTTNNQFDFAEAGLVLGDTVDLRLDFTVTTSGSNDDLSIKLNLAIGSSGPYTLTTNYNQWRNAGTYSFASYYGIYMGNTDTVNFPGEVCMYAGTAGDSVQVNGWYVRVVPRKPVLA